MAHLEPIHLAEVSKQLPGSWVAIRDDEIVEARRTFDEVLLALRERDIVNATIIRVPEEHESEFIGIG